jgi:integrase
VWDEVDFENAVWTIPKERMKRSKAHNVYLSRRVLDIMIALKTCAGNSSCIVIGPRTDVHRGDQV